MQRFKEGMKRCKTCGELKLILLHTHEKTFEFFPKTKTGHGAHCKRCIRSKHLFKKYGITLDEWEKMLYSQKGECPICGKKQSEAKSTFHVDHNHKTGDIRAIICGYCNRYLMMYLHDNPKRAIGLAKYLRKHFHEAYNEV